MKSTRGERSWPSALLKGNTTSACAGLRACGAFRRRHRIGRYAPIWIGENCSVARRLALTPYAGIVGAFISRARAIIFLGDASRRRPGMRFRWPRPSEDAALKRGAIQQKYNHFITRGFQANNTSARRAAGIEGRTCQSHSRNECRRIRRYNRNTSMRRPAENVARRPRHATAPIAIAAMPRQLIAAAELTLVLFFRHHGLMRQFSVHAGSCIAHVDNLKNAAVIGVPRRHSLLSWRRPGDHRLHLDVPDMAKADIASLSSRRRRPRLQIYSRA